MSSDLVHTTAQYIVTAFDIGDELVVPESITLEEIRKGLVERIIHLLNVNPEKLMSILYRIDVSETRVNEIFAHAMPPDIPEQLADLIIERQLQKARTRRQGS